MSQFLKQSNQKGLFIVFEGLDGSGLSTQAGLLQEKLHQEKYDTMLTKEPTNNIIGGLIRGKLKGEWQIDAKCLQLLFAADRAHHLAREVIPALSQKKIVICDRYLFSSIAFGSLELDKNWLMDLNRNFLLPDITFLLKVPPKICLERITSHRFEMELFEKEEKLKKVWKTYLWLAKKFDNIFIIDGTKTKKQVSRDIFDKLESLKIF